MTISKSIHLRARSLVFCMSPRSVLPPLQYKRLGARTQEVAGQRLFKWFSARHQLGSALGARRKSRRDRDPTAGACPNKVISNSSVVSVLLELLWRGKTVAFRPKPSTLYNVVASMACFAYLRLLILILYTFKAVMSRHCSIVSLFSAWPQSGAKNYHFPPVSERVSQSVLAPI